jgi:hypothetical protein
VDIQQGVVLQLGGWLWSKQILTTKTGLVMKRIHVPWPWADPLWEDNIKMGHQEVGWGGVCGLH